MYLRKAGEEKQSTDAEWLARVRHLLSDMAKIIVINATLLTLLDVCPDSRASTWCVVTDDMVSISILS